MARVTHGEWEGCLALVVDERDATGRFLIYIASDHPDNYRSTDFLAALNDAEGFGLGLDWLSPEDDLRLEVEVFGVRQHYREQAAYRALPRWRRFFTPKCRCG